MIYADNAATTRLSSAAREAMLPYLDSLYGNPSSLHAAGREARAALETARERVASCMGAAPEEILFTSGGSESDNQALITAAAYGKRRGRTHLVSTAVEHHAVLHTLKKLEAEGFEVTILPVDGNGAVTPGQVRTVLRPDTAAVSVMYANNEIGTVMPISEIGAVCRAAGVLFHTDAVAAMGHIPIDVVAQNIDMLSLSAHKFHGPKGVGALYIKEGIPAVSLIEGGAQENGRRAGTENVAGAVGMAMALSQAHAHREANAAHARALRDKLIEGLLCVPHSVLCGDRIHRLPGNVHMCFEGVEGEALLLMLDAEGICASSGSACTSGSQEPSHVLSATGLPLSFSRGALRLSLDEFNTEAEVDRILEVVPRIVATLRKLSSAQNGGAALR